MHGRKEGDNGRTDDVNSVSGVPGAERTRRIDVEYLYEVHRLAFSAYYQLE